MRVDFSALIPSTRIQAIVCSCADSASAAKYRILGERHRENARSVVVALYRPSLLSSSLLQPLSLCVSVCVRYPSTYHLSLDLSIYSSMYLSIPSLYPYHTPSPLSRCPSRFRPCFSLSFSHFIPVYMLSLGIRREYVSRSTTLPFDRVFRHHPCEKSLNREHLNLSGDIVLISNTRHHSHL